MAADDDLQRYFNGLTGKMRKQLAGVIDDEANQLADAIRAAAPSKETAHLRNSVRVEPGRDDLEKWVAAGGSATTVHNYDYSLAVEFGTEHNAAQPFFWPTYRARRDKIRQNIMTAIEQALKG
jgi:HK97 gp10 family phage protein